MYLGVYRLPAPVPVPVVPVPVPVPTGPGGGTGAGTDRSRYRERKSGAVPIRFLFFLPYWRPLASRTAWWTRPSPCSARAYSTPAPTDTTRHTDNTTQDAFPRAITGFVPLYVENTDSTYLQHPLSPLPAVVSATPPCRCRSRSRVGNSAVPLPPT